MHECMYYVDDGHEPHRIISLQGFIWGGGGGGGGGAGVLAPSPMKLSVVTCTKPNNNRNVNNWSNDSKIPKNLLSNAICNMYKYLLVPN